MVRHVCGTCRFFQASDGNRKSGWCGHPLKQTTTDVQILVRAGELNCRNDWDTDLWQLREDGDRVLDVSMVKPGDHNDRDRLGRPQRPEPRRTLGEDEPRPGRQMAAADDVLIGEESDGPRLVSEDINREMLKRAREQYRARRQATRPDGPSPRLSDGPAPVIHRSEPIVISNEVLPHQIGAEPGPDLTRVSRRGSPRAADERTVSEMADNAFSSVPHIEGAVELPRRTARRAQDVPTVDDFAMESLRSYDEVMRSGRPISHESGDNRSVSDDEPVWSHEPTWTDEAPQGDALETRLDDSASSRSAESAPLADVRTADPDEIRPWGYVEPRRSRPSDSDPRDFERAEPPSMSPLWEDLPRCCRTCRDFRAAEAGGRGGWCTNRWAFRHRRMVDADQLTCETTIGDWWLPSDEAWQDDFDIGRHALSTPLMDKWFGRPEEESETYYPQVASRTRRRS